MGFFDSISDFMSGGNYGESEYAANRAVDALENLRTPDVSEMVLRLEEAVRQGEMTPEDAKLFLQQQSDANNISTDPKLMKAQTDALDSLQDIGQNGMTDMDRAKLAKIASQEATQSRGAREAILSNANARGVGGSGVELMSSLQNAQGTADRQAERDTEVAGMAQERALQALQGAGVLGGQMQDRSFSQQLAKSDRNDAINQFNTANMNQSGQFNTKARNDAAAANLAEKQRIADANVAQRNQQQQYNKDLAQRDFDNKYRKAGGVATGLNGLADTYNQKGQQTSQMVGSGIQAGATAIAASDENFKTDIEDFDASDFLDSLTPTKFKYKNPEKHGEGTRVGVMAQDMEKKAPELVVEGEDGKYIDYNKAGGRLFASLADMNQRLKKVEGK